MGLPILFRDAPPAVTLIAQARQAFRFVWSRLWSRVN